MGMADESLRQDNTGKSSRGRVNGPRNESGRFVFDVAPRRVGNRIRCGTCQKLKHENTFSPYMRIRHSGQFACKLCCAAKNKRIAQGHRARGRCKCGRERLSNLSYCSACYWGKIKSTYGLDQKGYEQIVESQNGRCAICRSESSGVAGHRLFIDHDHNSKKIRGLLCNRCNWIVGMIEGGDEHSLLKAKEYLGRTS